MFRISRSFKSFAAALLLAGAAVFPAAAKDLVSEIARKLQSQSPSSCFVIKGPSESGAGVLEALKDGKRGLQTARRRARFLALRELGLAALGDEIPRKDVAPELLRNLQIDLLAAVNFSVPLEEKCRFYEGAEEQKGFYWVIAAAPAGALEAVASSVKALPSERVDRIYLRLLVQAAQESATCGRFAEAEKRYLAADRLSKGRLDTEHYIALSRVMAANGRLYSREGGDALSVLDRLYDERGDLLTADQKRRIDELYDIISAEIEKSDAQKDAEPIAEKK